MSDTFYMPDSIELEQDEDIGPFRLQLVGSRDADGRLLFELLYYDNHNHPYSHGFCMLLRTYSLEKAGTSRALARQLIAENCALHALGLDIVNINAAAVRQRQLEIHNGR